MNDPKINSFGYGGSPVPSCAGVPPPKIRLQRIWVARTPRHPSCSPQCLHCSLLGAAICLLGRLTTGSITSLLLSA